MNDFADWLSPIVVKELRQGMRSRVFVGTFLIIQFFMIFCVAGSLGERGEREFGTGMFWTLFVISILIATPLRGLGRSRVRSRGTLWTWCCSRNFRRGALRLGNGRRFSCNPLS